MVYRGYCFHLNKVSGSTIPVLLNENRVYYIINSLQNDGFCNCDDFSICCVEYLVEIKVNLDISMFNLNLVELL